MPTITGTLKTILNETAEPGTIEVALCGYGSQVPRINALGLGARVTDDGVAINPDGTFTFDVDGNDDIVPDGTYYTVTVKDSNGDIIQVNAYRFISTDADYDLNLIPPYDPNQPPPPLPPLLTNYLLEVPYSAAPNFDGSILTSWHILLIGDAAATVSGLVEGNLYTFIIEQDGQGAHIFTWPAGVTNATPVDLDPNSFTVQTFIALAPDQLLPIGAGTYNL
jgi:hypothetical protein